MDNKSFEDEFGKESELKKCLGRIKGSFDEKTAKELMWAMARGGNKVCGWMNKMLDNLDEKPRLKAWFLHGLLCGTAVQLVPMTGLILRIPGTGALAGGAIGYLVGSNLKTQVQSSVTGFVAGTVFQPVMVYSPFLGLTLMSVAAGCLEEFLVGVCRDGRRDAERSDR